MDSISVFRKAVDQTGRIVANVQPDQYDAATPCADWKVRDLLSHTVTVTESFDAGSRGDEYDMATFGQDRTGEDLRAAFETAAQGIYASLDRPDVLDGEWNMPFGTTPAPMAIAFATLELFVHGWDLARATGQDVAFDEEVAQAAMETAKAIPAEMLRQPGVFGAEAECADDAPLHDRVAAFLGRTVPTG